MKQKLPKNHLFRLIFPAIYGSVLYVLILLVFENFEYVFKSFFSNELIFIVVLSYLSSELMHLISRIIAWRFSFIDKIFKYIILQILTSLIAEFLLVFLAIHLYFTIVEGFSVYSTELTIFEMFFLFSALLYNLFIISYLLLNRENTIQNEQEQELKKKNEYLIQQIKNEIDPDVFYEMMESLLIYNQTDPITANDIINRISILYRYRLENKFNEMVLLKNELEALENLIILYKHVYPGSIEFSISKNSDIDEVSIVPLWLQKIILTIIHCNIISPNMKLNLSLEIYQENIYLKHTRFEKLLISETVEMEKISSDFEFFTNRKIEITQNETDTIMTIPVFNSKTIQMIDN